ncbi:cation transporter [Micromonospora endolithica]|uniref:Cation transporter n=1 Tax=Micromonospora endolithica TaxID=230091 RepID=A0A3A9ZPZ6_9ACTN|nr:cation transporter [Micromonospora endolithica]RKN50302.1 cation transporter [Micromonospora endolithica]TWJ21043.1 cation efflux family protein [Micromonospora endolithica]
MTGRDEALRRRAQRLAWLIIGWDVIEGAVAVTAGLIAGSIALVGFGIDSTIEVFAAAVIVWQLRGGARARQASALRLIAGSFLALSGYVTYKSISDLIDGERPDASLVGIALNVVALAVMIPVAVAQRRTARALDNQAVFAQSQETWVSNYLSVSLLVGLGLNAALGWWWADPVAALVVAGVAAKAGIDAWRESREYQREQRR